MEIIDFSNCEYSNRHGRYGGNAGDKDGIIYQNENWIIKYPKTTKSMVGKDLPSYTTSPLSEYVGSHIYEILGYNTHETKLGIRQGKLVVACKDFQKHFGDLAEIRTIKNAAHEQMQNLSEEKLPISATGDSVNFEEILFHLDNNPLLQIKGLKERFYDQIIVDIFINNNDRNNGNWGILFTDEGKEIAPVFDNGNSFSNKMSEEKILKVMELSEKEKENLFMEGRTAYSFDSKTLSAKKMLLLDNDDIKQAIKRVYPKIKEKLPEIVQMIKDIPERYGDYEICSKLRKDFYIESLQVRAELLLEPAYEKVDLSKQKEEYISTKNLNELLGEHKLTAPNKKIDDLER